MAKLPLETAGPYQIQILDQYIHGMHAYTCSQMQLLENWFTLKMKTHVRQDQHQHAQQKFGLHTIPILDEKLNINLCQYILYPIRPVLDVPL